MQPKHYAFRSQWRIVAPRQTVWDAVVESPASWPEWWPELKNVHNISRTPDIRGSSFSCLWRAKGYKLTCDIKVDDVDELKAATLSSDGDLQGSANCSIEETDGVTHIKILWKVTTAKRWMNLLAPLLKPIFIYNHHAIMKSGERGLRRHVA